MGDLVPQKWFLLKLIIIHTLENRKKYAGHLIHPYSSTSFVRIHSCIASPEFKFCLQPRLAHPTFNKWKYRNFIYPPVLCKNYNFCLYRKLSNDRFNLSITGSIRSAWSKIVFPVCLIFVFSLIFYYISDKHHFHAKALYLWELSLILRITWVSFAFAFQFPQNFQLILSNSFTSFLPVHILTPFNLIHIYVKCELTIFQARLWKETWNLKVNWAKTYTHTIYLYKG